MTAFSVVTSSWFTPLPREYARIGISRGQPRGQSGYRMYRKLAPGSWFKSVSVEEFRKRYMGQLADLDAGEVLAEIKLLADGRNAALLCFERPGDGQICHRGYVSAWLKEATGLDVVEFGLEDSGSGWGHPKLIGTE